MPDLQQFTITSLSSANVNVPRARIEARVVDSQTGALIADLTGANAITFPGVLTQLTVDQRRELIELVATWLIQVRAGVA